MTSKNWALAGATLLVAGLFTPILSVPILGNVNLFNNGSNLLAIALVILAATSAALAAKDRVQEVIFPGIASAGILLYVFGSLQYRLTQMREAVSAELANNPFAGFAQAAVGSVQLQWGWLVLAAGAGLLVYSAFAVRRDTDEGTAVGSGLFSLGDGIARAVAGISALLLVAAPAWDLFSRGQQRAGPGATTAPDEMAATRNSANLLGAASADSRGPSQEEAAYIRQNLRIYDLEARYFDSILDGRIPGVRFKIRNTGNRTLNSVKVRVVFRDANGNAIAEEEYHPVLVTEYGYGDNNSPLRPNYIWQQDGSQFLAARNVPSEWAAGRATANIIDIEFAPHE